MWNPLHLWRGGCPLTTHFSKPSFDLLFVMSVTYYGFWKQLLERKKLLRAEFLNTSKDTSKDSILILPEVTRVMLTKDNITFPIHGYISEEGDDYKHSRHDFSIIGFEANGEDLVLEWNETGYSNESLCGLLDGLAVGDEFDRDSNDSRIWSYVIRQVD